MSQHIAIPDLPHGSYTVFAAASARYYHAQPGSKAPHWEYSRYRGTLVFGKTFSSKAAPQDDYWFKLLVSKSGETKTVWLFKLFTNLNYQVDKPFFHVIHGLTRRYGFLFDDDDEATMFADQVRANYTPSVSEKYFPARLMPRQRLLFRSKSNPGKFRSKQHHTPATTISAPLADSFRHIMHIGLNKFGVLETRGLEASEPPWEAVLSSFRGSKSSLHQTLSDHLETPAVSVNEEQDNILDTTRPSNPDDTNMAYPDDEMPCTTTPPNKPIRKPVPAVCPDI